jgi:hypothetical protein
MGEKPEKRGRMSVFLAVLSAVIAAFSAGFVYLQARQGIDTEERVVFSELLNRFDSDEMGRARRTLISYIEYLKHHNITDENAIISMTADYFGYYVYYTISEIPQTPLQAFAHLGSADTNAGAYSSFFAELDASRRRVRSFYSDLMIYKCHFLTPRFSSYLPRSRYTDEIIAKRFKPAARFLQVYWLPIEEAQKKVRIHKSGSGKITEGMIRFYENDMKLEFCT